MFIVKCVIDATIPAPIDCSKSGCSHVVVYGRHFDPDDWARWTAANDTITGQY